MSNKKVNEGFIDACVSVDLDKIMEALDGGASPRAFDEAGNPGWWFLLKTEFLDDVSCAVQAQAFQAMIDHGLKITHGMLDTVSMLIANHSTACALPLLLSLDEDLLNDFLFNSDNSHGNDMAWWGEVYAEHKKDLMQRKTDEASSNGPSPRF